MPDGEHNHRISKRDLAGTVGATGKLIARKISADKTEEEVIRVVNGHLRSSSIELDEQGNLRHSIQGTSPRGEDGSVEVCNLLIERLNSDGACWGAASQPKGRERGIDCEAMYGARTLQIQVTRLPARRMWAALANRRAVSCQTTVDGAADELRKAIKHKESTPLADRPSITLAINALDTAGHALPAVAEHFRHKYGAEMSNLGFESIWIVGPIVSLVMRLDA